MQNIHKITVCPETAARVGADLFQILESLLPVKFEWEPDNRIRGAGQIIFGDRPGRPNPKDEESIPSLVLPQCGGPGSGGKLKNLRVQFSDEREVPFPFRGRSLLVQVEREPKGLSISSGETALAKTEQGVVWCVSAVGKAQHFRTAFELPTIPAHGGLQDVLNGDRFLEILPLLHFLRRVCAHELYEQPRLRAQFMFDDPNLHWPSYGYVDYKEIATRAEKENYHVSFATVPLDGWITHGRAAAVFRDAPTRLSFCVHGNNHTKRELAQDCAQADRAALLQQALRRIEALEVKAGVEVSRVMVPPHGACLHEMLEELPRRGFESACISHGSLRAHNRGRAWAKNLGYLPSELIGGCPVLPRWGLANSNESTVLLAAYLRQPIILRGHHQDLRGGIELLDGFARIVNSLGDVVWSNMNDISRLNYSWRMEGSTFKVKPLGLKLNVRVPEEAKTIMVESWEGKSSDAWRVLEDDSSIMKAREAETMLLQTAGRHCLTLEAVTPVAVSHELNGTSLPVAAFVRRLLTEGRDRLVGALGR